jgi:hypothetical protein
LLLIGSQGTHGIAPSLYSKLPYDPVKDFEHVSILAVAGFMLVVHPSVPADEPERTDRAGEKESRQTQLRVRQRFIAADVRDDQQHGRHSHCPDSL